MYHTWELCDYHMVTGVNCIQYIVTYLWGYKPNNSQLSKPQNFPTNGRSKTTHQEVVAKNTSAIHLQARDFGFPRATS